MTQSEKYAIEIWSADISGRLGFTRPKVVLSKKYDRIDIHTVCMGRRTNEEFAERLAKKLEVAGWHVDVWPIYPGRVFVSNKGIKK